MLLTSWRTVKVTTFSLSLSHTHLLLQHHSSPLPHCSALDLLQTAIEKAGFTEKVVVGMDVAASEFYREGKYDLDFKSPPDSSRHISADELADIYQSFVNNYPGEASFLCLFKNVILLSDSSFPFPQWCPSRTPSTRTTGRPGPT